MNLFDEPSSSVSASLLVDLNEAQREAVSCVEGPLLIIAGAGSGKTKVLTHRLAYLLAQQKAHAHELLALTFTNKAAREMRDRINRLIGHDADKLWMGTFHSIFCRILRLEAHHIGYSNQFSIYDSEDSEKMIRNILKELNYDVKEIKPSAIKFRISSAKNALIDAVSYATLSRSSMDDIAAQVYPIYESRLKLSRAFDFDDLLVKPIQLFEQHPLVLERWQDRFRYIMIDEYQDTNKAQYQVSAMLASKHRNLCVVGDDAQSIYSFRGADITNILEFETTYPDAVRIALERNYRSTGMILKCADSVIKQNVKQLAKTLYTKNEAGDPITVYEHFDEREEANRVVTQLHQNALRNGYSYREYAILYRTNYQSRVFEEAFRRRDVPYRLIGGVSFYQRKEVKDVIAYLKLLINPNDEEALLRVINEPARGIGDKTLSEILQQAHGQGKPLWDILTGIDTYDIYKPAKAKIKEFTEIVSAAAAMMDEATLIDVARMILEKTGYVQQYIQEGTHEALGRRENIIELLNALAYYQQQHPEGDLSGFLQDISLITDMDTVDEDKPAVTLMTVHAAKGLEFNVVYIVGLEEELFPIGARQGEVTDLEEERRLFYVAVTRAKKELFLSHARSRFRFGEQRSALRSRFIDEIDPTVLRNEVGASIRPLGARSEYGFLSTPTSIPIKNQGDSRIEYDSAPTRTTLPKPKSSGIEIHYDADNDPFQPGVLVIHPTFGPGKILSRLDQGPDTTVSVFFQQHGQKKLVLRFAKLKPLHTS